MALNSHFVEEIYICQGNLNQINQSENLNRFFFLRSLFLPEKDLFTRRDREELTLAQTEMTP
jgi:hypothetical protein